MVGGCKLAAAQQRAALTLRLRHINVVLFTMASAAMR